MLKDEQSYTKDSYNEEANTAGRCLWYTDPHVCRL